MKIIKLTAKTKKGNEALKIHIAESKKLSFNEKLVFKTAGFKQEVISEEPYTLQLTINNRHTENPLYIELLSGQIRASLKKNKAGKQDYNIEVLKK